MRSILCRPVWIVSVLELKDADHTKHVVGAPYRPLRLEVFSILLFA